MSKRISNKKAKQLVLNAHLATIDDEVLWLLETSIKANGTSMNHYEYIGDLDCPSMLFEVDRRARVLGL